MQICFKRILNFVILIFDFQIEIREKGRILRIYTGEIEPRYLDLKRLLASKSSPIMDEVPAASCGTAPGEYPLTNFDFYPILNKIFMLSVLVNN